MTKPSFFSLLLILSAIMFLPSSLSARVTIGSTDTPHDFSVLELISNNTMGFRLPQMDYEQRRDLRATLPALDSDGLSPAMGLQVFCIDTRCVYTWNGMDWIQLCCPDGPRVPSAAAFPTTDFGITVSDDNGTFTAIEYFFY